MADIDAVIRRLFPADVWSDLTREKAERAARDAAQQQDEAGS